MRRMALTLIIAALLAASSTAPALAAIHEIAQSECSAATGTVADTQEPPGQDPDNSVGSATSKLQALSNTVIDPQNQNAKNATSGEGADNCTFPESSEEEA